MCRFWAGGISSFPFSRAREYRLLRRLHFAMQSCRGFALVMGDTIEKVSKSSILTKVSILSILEKSIGNSIPLEPAMFLVSIPDQSLNTS
jgi:hypothetical protein